MIVQRCCHNTTAQLWQKCRKRLCGENLENTLLRLQKIKIYKEKLERDINKQGTIKLYEFIEIEPFEVV